MVDWLEEAIDISKFEIEIYKLINDKSCEVIIGTNAPGADVKEKDGSHLHGLFRRFQIQSKILDDQMYFQVEMPVTIYTSNGQQTEYVQMIQLTVNGSKSPWNKYEFNTNYSFQMPQFRNGFANHLLEPFTNIQDNQRAHACIIFAVMMLVHEKNEDLKNIEKWNV